MGYPMVVNLRAKIGRETTILVCDVNQDALKKFEAEEAKHGPVGIVKSGFEAAQRAVSGTVLDSGCEHEGAADGRACRTLSSLFCRRAKP